MEKKGPISNRFEVVKAREREGGMKLTEREEGYKNNKGETNGNVMEGNPEIQAMIAAGAQVKNNVSTTMRPDSMIG